MALLNRTNFRVTKWILWMAAYCVAYISAYHNTMLAPDEFSFKESSYSVSIQENCIGKHYAVTHEKIGIHVKNADLSVSYNITGGDGAEMFKAESRRVGDFSFLRIRTLTSNFGEFNRERKNLYILNLTAHGKYLFSTLRYMAKTQIFVNILDENDLNPLFMSSTYNAVVDENAPILSHVITVTATDADIGINGDIYYSFAEVTDEFAIHPTSGVVYVTHPLDYLKQRSYLFHLKATDRGAKLSGAKYGVASLKINVNPVNLHAPNIAVRNLPAVVEHAKPGTIYAIITVTDQDQNIQGEIASVKISGADGIFDIVRVNESRGEYNIIIRSDIDREVKPAGYNLTIHACDKGSPSKKSTAVISITITDSNDNYPHFTQEKYFIRIDEDVPLNTPLLFVHAGDLDLGMNADIEYSIVSGNAYNWFRINSMYGLISTRAYLDYETGHTVNLVIRAEDKANVGSRLSSTATVVVSLVDVNDNGPVFNMTSNFFTITENISAYTPVFRVLVNDRDSGDNGFFSFSIANVNTVPFVIDRFSGVVSNRYVLDYETDRLTYKIKVRVSDWGEPFQRESEMVFVINVTDVNDNRPNFEIADCYGTVSRNIPNNTHLLKVSAIDFDRNNVVSYQIISGNDDSCFHMHSKGLLSNSCSFNSTLKKYRNLVIKATDNFSLSDPLIINITLTNNNNTKTSNEKDVNIKCRKTDILGRFHRLIESSKINNAENQLDVMSEIPNSYLVNSHAPIFPDNIVKVIELSEGAKVGTVVASLIAYDEDSGYNGQLTYAIVSGDIGYFNMDLRKGNLMVFSPLDRETVSEFHLAVNVTDGGQPRKSATHNIVINIFDENDNAPSFSESVYEKEIPEDTAVQSTILQVTAYDLDIGENSDITYRLLPPVMDFSIDDSTGEIYIKQHLDRERQDHYDIIVQAVDHGRIPLSSTALIKVKIQDINDNKPSFTLKKYHVKIREDLPPETVVMTIAAYDADSGEAGRLLYGIYSGCDEKFRINNVTGIIRLRHRLNYKVTQIYKCTVFASDFGIPSLTTTAKLVIEIVGVNKNQLPPKFKDFVAEGIIYENEPIGSIVMRVVAQDPDSERRDDSDGIVYSVRDGSGLGFFSIDRNGTIRTTQSLDRESAKSYWLTVFAQDRSPFPLSTRLDVFIRVLDINDNIPQTLKPVYYGSVFENSHKGIKILKVEGEDLDQNQAQRLSFTITSGNQNKHFEIDSVSGEISTGSEPLDRETQEEHTLEVTVNDNGRPNLSSSTNVIIRVLDLNDHKPQFKVTRQVVQILQPDVNNSVGIPVYRVMALDRDSGRNAALSYLLRKPSDWCYIHKHSGIVFTKIPLAVGKMYDTTIRAYDRGKPIRRSSPTRLKVIVHERPVNSTSPPRFVNSEDMMAVVLESDEVGTMVMQVVAVDDDHDKLWYNISAGNDDLKFTMGPESNLVLLAGQLHWENKSDYNLTISVTDGVHTAYSWLHIQVYNVNRDPPTFTQAAYTVSVGENISVGASILSVKVKQDKGQLQTVLYSISKAANLASLEKFKIDPVTGVIKVQEALDHEQMSSHHLTVMARHQGSQQQRGYAILTIHVHDVNDHHPAFLAKQFYGSVFETATIGTSVLQIMAVDHDKGDNAQLSYAIVSGNVGNTFIIHEKLGTITIAKELDRSVRSEYFLVVTATDHGSPALSSSVKVHIKVTVANNAAPIFDQSPQYSIDIPEDMTPEHNLRTVHATSASSIVYEMISEEHNNIFRVNPYSGLVSLIGNVDYEKVNFYNITIQATNIVQVSSVVNFLVHILDVNDHRPEFIEPYHEGSIKEVSDIGSLILNAAGQPLVVKATDADSGVNSLLQYRIVEPYARLHFSIDHNTGSIRTADILDYEQITRVEFTVQVTDLGRPPKNAEIGARVVIHVLDVNDSPPVFVKDEYHVTVLLPTYRDIALIKIEAHDADSPEYNQLEYAISKGNNDSMFRIDRRLGDLYVYKDTNVSFVNRNITVTASDGKFLTETVVQILYKELNSSKFLFTESVYHASIAEKQTTVKTLAIIRLKNHLLNQHLTFRILNPNRYFVVHSTSGAIQTTGKALDREEEPSYQVIIEVQDHQTSDVGHVRVNISVADVNDNAPVFLCQPYHVLLPVNSTSTDSQPVIQVSAFDRDVEENARVSYKLSQSARDRFLIDAHTGDIKLARNLDIMDAHSVFVFTVIATDHGSPPLSSSASVTVNIITVATPRFDNHTYTVRVPENVDEGSAILSIMATSRFSEKLIYSIVDGDPYGEFSVHFSTDMNIMAPCVITVHEPLDYETQPQYRLTVRAINIQNGVSADASVIVNVTDVNDNPPIFRQFTYRANVSELSKPGSVVLKVSATDADSGNNQVIDLALEELEPDKNHTSYFRIDTQSGIVTTQVALDHEKLSDLSFKVIARDNGMPVLSSSAYVYIHVLDINDNIPRFTRPIFSCTITDQIKPGQFVTVVTAYDADSVDANRLTYSILAGNVKQTFDISENTGMISMSKHTKLHLLSVYDLNISVSDGVFLTYARLNIQVKHLHNDPPEFTEKHKMATVKENLPIGIKVADVKVWQGGKQDLDSIKYAIISDTARRFFHIDSVSGMIHTTVVFDRETCSSYRIPVAASDTTGQMAFTSVDVTIDDQNDNAPQFMVDEYQGTVMQNAAPGTHVIQVSAHDADSGINKQLYYTFYKPDPQINRLFSINSDSGRIITKTILTSNVSEVYQFFVMAKDKGNPSLDNKVPVKILVISTDDVSPAFPQKSYKFFIPETTRIGTVIATINAASNQDIKYSLHMNSHEKFLMKADGRIIVKGQLDYEIQDLYHLMIQAMTLTSPSLVGHTEVSIHVMDVNDNAPIFEMNPYLVTVPENTVSGSHVVTVQAIDLDDGLAGTVRYGFGFNVGFLANMFSIDAETGDVTLLVELDREKCSEYNLTVIASDLDADIVLRDTTQIKISVTDYNDKSPIFSQSLYKGAVNEDADIGTVILSVSATDDDIDGNADINYFIIEGDSCSQFDVKKSGEVIINRALDRETKLAYKLKVVATDGQFVVEAYVLIDILDANDNSPFCEQSLIHEYVSENQAPGYYIHKFIATDADEANTPNSLISYTLAGTGSQDFHLDRLSGLLTTSVYLDRETTSQYHMYVNATDSDGRFCTMEIYATVLDTNDNSPVFTHLPTHEFRLPENAGANTLLTRVTAIDKDLGLKGRVSYQLKASIPDNNFFKIDSHTGIISVAKAVDRESHPSLKIIVEAFDDQMVHITELKLSIVILDINDNPPVFERMTYKFSVEENSSRGSEVFTIVATSKDEGLNAEISYSIISGNELGKFRMAPHLGAVSVAGDLDYEQSRQYFLEIQAQDGGTPALSSSVVVQVDVIDVNDNTPTFSRQRYSAAVKENTVQNTSVTQLIASDKDDGVNAQLTYTIINGNDDSMFHLNESDGALTVYNPLDRETRDIYELVVQVCDKGIPQLSSTALLSVTVIDVNDNSPVFSLTNYTAFIQKPVNAEDMKIGRSVLKFTVSDEDLEPNGAPFSFEISGGNHGHKFQIDNDGVLRIAGTFYRKLKDTYKISVRVFDNGIPALYTDTDVVIHVVEKNVHEPEIQPLVISINSPSAEYSGGPIGRVTATDADRYDKLSYRVEPPNADLFMIGLNDGRLRAVPGLDAGEYNVNVSVSDGKHTTYGTVHVNIVHISSDAVHNAVTIQFAKILPEEFLQIHMNNFKQVLTRELSINTKDIIIINVQPAVELPTGRNRLKRSGNNNVDVLFAVRKPSGSFFRKNYLRRKLMQLLNEIEKATSVKVIGVFGDVCKKNSCIHGKCIGVVTFEKDRSVPVNLGSESFVTGRHRYTFTCVCMRGYTGDRCEIILPTCEDHSCASPKVCISSVTHGYRCVCPAGRRGHDCSEVIINTSLCTDNFCQRGDKPMTFSGKSYARWRLVEGMERHLSVSLKIKTRLATAFLMYAYGAIDYIILELSHGVLQFRFNLGSGEGIVALPHPVADGTWHEIIVDRDGNNAEILLDGKFTAQASAPGINDLLNLASHQIYFGAKVKPLTGGFYDVNTGFEGCMEAIRVNGVRLPVTGSNSVAKWEDFKDIEFHCRDSSINTNGVSGSCANIPCLNGGSCISTGDYSYRCLCLPRYKGSNCEIDLNPCGSNPCMHGGTCVNKAETPSQFVCKCTDGLRGKRCNYGYYCQPHTCHNQGMCIEGPTAPICHCSNGYLGQRCETKITPCQQNPCKNGATCHQVDQDLYVCNCSSGRAGKHCDIINYHSSTSGSHRIPITKVIIIAVCVVVGIAIIVALIVIGVHFRRRQRLRQSQGVAHDQSDVLLNSFHTDKTKQILKPLNLDPKCTNRIMRPNVGHPSSYTPIEHYDSHQALNNFDLARDYDTEELQTYNKICNTYATATRMQTFSPPGKSVPVATSSDTESLQKASWDADCPNIQENYEEDKKASSQVAKVMPLDSPVMSRVSRLRNHPMGSYTSLPMSEIDDDLPGYHWDTSDWAPHSELPDINEVTHHAVPDISTSEHSTDSNTHINDNAPYNIVTTPPQDEPTTNLDASDDDISLGTSQISDTSDVNFDHFHNRTFGIHPNKYLPSYSPLCHRSPAVPNKSLQLVDDAISDLSDHSSISSTCLKPQKPQSYQQQSSTGTFMMPSNASKHSSDSDLNDDNSQDDGCV